MIKEVKNYLDTVVKENKAAIINSCRETIADYLIECCEQISSFWQSRNSFPGKLLGKIKLSRMVPVESMLVNDFLKIEQEAFSIKDFFFKILDVAVKACIYQKRYAHGIGNRKRNAYADI